MDIKKPHFCIAITSAVLLSMFSGALSAETLEETVSLQADKLEHIQFGKIKANRVTYRNQHLQIDVDNSASILMLSFDVIKPLNKVSFEWRSESGPLAKDSQHELKRSGDDAIFKLGLLLASDEDLLNPFIPPWLKQVREQLKHPSEEMIYLVVGARHTPGERWVSPYNRRVTMVSVASQETGSGWQKSTFRSEQPLDVVALWLMADGDNTHSAFSVAVKNIVLEKRD